MENTEKSEERISSGKLNINKINEINETSEEESNKYLEGNKNINYIENEKNNNIIYESNYNKINKNTIGENKIIINETLNNNTFINFIEIKNNYEPNNINNINNDLDFENEAITHIPDDGITNKLIETFSPNKTLSGMNKENVDNLIDIKKKNTYRGKSMVNFDFLPERGLKDDKLALLNDYLYGNDFLSPKNNKEKIHNSHNSFNELNHYNIDNDNEHNNNDNIKEEKKEEIYTQKNIIGMNTPKRTIKKMKFKIAIR